MRTYLFAAAVPVLFLVQAPAQAASAVDILTPHLALGQIYSNVFSIMRAIKADGYDEVARRNGGSADYTVLAVKPDSWRLRANWRYDGGQSGNDEEIELRDGGRTKCAFPVNAPQKCDPYLDGSGLIYNTALWGVPPKELTAGTTWKVDIPQAWELGGAHGQQQVTVITVDDSTGTAVLMREGTAVGFFGEGEPSQRELTRDGRKETLGVVPGTAHWKGYTTIVRGVIFSDELLVTREAVLHGKTTDSHATERWIMLLNAAPPPTLRNSDHG